MTTDNAEVKDSASLAATPQHDSLRQRAVRRLWRAQNFYVIGLAAFGVLALFAHTYAYFGWDYKVSSAFNWKTFTPPGLFDVMRAVSFFGNRWIPWALTLLTVILFYVFRKRSEAAGLLLSAGGGALINFLFKLLIGRPRPADDLIAVYRDDLQTKSFPSGHVTFYVCYFGFLFFVAFALLPRGSTVRRIALILAALPIVLVGFSRVYLGAHWSSDTLGAYLLSGLWLALSLHLYRRWKQRATFHRKRKDEG